MGARKCETSVSSLQAFFTISSFPNISFSSQIHKRNTDHLLQFALIHVMLNKRHLYMSSQVVIHAFNITATRRTCASLESRKTEPMYVAKLRHTVDSAKSEEAKKCNQITCYLLQGTLLQQDVGPQDLSTHLSTLLYHSHQ